MTLGGRLKKLTDFYFLGTVLSFETLFTSCQNIRGSRASCVKFCYFSSRFEIPHIQNWEQQQWHVWSRSVPSSNITCCPSSNITCCVTVTPPHRIILWNNSFWTHIHVPRILAHFVVMARYHGCSFIFIFNIQFWRIRLVSLPLNLWGRALSRHSVFVEDLNNDLI